MKDKQLSVGELKEEEFRVLKNEAIKAAYRIMYTEIMYEEKEEPVEEIFRKAILDMSNYETQIYYRGSIFVCLRCGRCCCGAFSRFEEDLSQVFCKKDGYFIPRRIENGKFLLAECKVHKDPQRGGHNACSNYVSSSHKFGICLLGYKIWEDEKLRHPDIEICSQLERLLNIVSFDFKYALSAFAVILREWKNKIYKDIAEEEKKKQEYKFWDRFSQLKLPLIISDI
jgi:hypothetical protein